MLKISLFKGKRSCRLDLGENGEFNCNSCANAGSSHGCTQEGLQYLLEKRYGFSWQKVLEKALNKEKIRECEHTIDIVEGKIRCIYCERHFSGPMACNYLELNFKGDWKQEWKRLREKLGSIFYKKQIGRNVWKFKG